MAAAATPTLSPPPRTPPPASRPTDDDDASNHGGSPLPACLLRRGSSPSPGGGRSRRRSSGHGRGGRDAADLACGRFWDDLAPSPSVVKVRSKHTAVAWEGKMVAFGGHDVNADLFVQDLLVYDMATASWRAVPPTATTPCARRAHSADVVGHHMVVFGGFSGDACLNDVHCLNLRTMEWSEVVVSGSPTDRPCSRGGHSTGVHDGRVHVFGGWDTSLTYHSDLWTADIDFATMRGTWRRVDSSAGEVPEGRVGHRSLVHRDNLVVFGGYGTRYYADTFVFNLTEGVWRRVVSPNGLCPEPRTYHSLVLEGDRVFLLGGSDEVTVMSGGWMLDCNTWTWTTVPCPGEGRFAHTCVMGPGGRLLVLGGSTTPAATDFSQLTIEDLAADASLAHFARRLLAARMLRGGCGDLRTFAAQLPDRVALPLLSYLARLEAARRSLSQEAAAAAAAVRTTKPAGLEAPATPGVIAAPPASAPAAAPTLNALLHSAEMYVEAPPPAATVAAAAAAEEMVEEEALEVAAAEAEDFAPPGTPATPVAASAAAAAAAATPHRVGSVPESPGGPPHTPSSTI